MLVFALLPALQASASTDVQRILGDGGGVAGVGLAVAVSILLRALLVGLSPLDPATYASVVVLLLAVGVIA